MTLGFLKKKHKKGIIFLIMSFLLFCCSVENNYSSYVRVEKIGSKKFFTFFVDDEFIVKNYKSPPWKKFPKISVAEYGLLLKLIKEDSKCGFEKFDIVIHSRQDKVYDITFTHLVSQNYRARPISPVIYNGECLPFKNNKNFVRHSDGNIFKEK